jgi:cytochrome bd-type quinol oxidase subunit 2
MKSLFKRTLLFLSLTMLSVIVWAQDKKVDVDINLNGKAEKSWFQQPIVWIIGAAIFVLLLVAILRPRERSN